MLGIIAEKPQESIGVGEGGQEAAGWGEAKLSYPRFGATCSVAARTAAKAYAGEQLRLGSVQGNRFAVERASCPCENPIPAPQK